LRSAESSQAGQGFRLTNLVGRELDCYRRDGRCRRHVGFHP
jgi:hypothetical protein